MGYSIDYIGKFNLNKPLTEEHSKFLFDFSYTRHFHRAWSPEEKGGIYWTDPDGKFDPSWMDLTYKEIVINSSPSDQRERKAYELSKWGCLDYNKVNPGMPSFYCQWIPTEDNMGITWDKGEKFYKAKEWLELMIENFFKPWGYILNGVVEIKNGTNEYPFDFGYLIVENNKIFIKE